MERVWIREYEDVEVGGRAEILCVCSGLWKLGEVKGGRKIGLYNKGPDYMSRAGSLAEIPAP